MKDFFKYVLASMVGFILANVIMGVLTLFIFLIGMGSMMSMADSFKTSKKVDVEEGSVLHVELDYPIAERTTSDPFRELEFALQERPKPVGLRDAIKSIEKAEDDEKIKGIYLNTSVIPTNYTYLAEIRKVLKEFKDSGKFVYAYSNIMSQKGYYLSSLADSIFLQPEGGMMFVGMNSEQVFLKGLFDKLEIQPHVIKAGAYKSAGEPFTEKEMSDAAREQTKALLETSHNHYLSKISSARGISVSDLQQMMDNMEIRTPEDAKSHGLVDELFYQDEMRDFLKNKLEINEDEDIEFVSLQDYTKTGGSKKDKETDNEIAIVYATGGIGMGQGDEESIGADRLSNAIKKAREDEDIKAIVLRVNSPGGSALASDIIWREVKLAREEKPIVVSMGNLAASGGYYISAPAHKIIAQPNTITGSIGVFGMFFEWQEFFNDKLGVTFDRVKTGKYADFGNPNRPMTEEEKNIIRDFIDETYQEFLSKVSEGRDMSIDQVDSIAQGRVWSGVDAKEIGLVDELGGIEKAIDNAAVLAGIEEEKYKITNLPEIESPFDRLMDRFSSDMKTRMIGEEFSETYEMYERLKTVSGKNDIYTLMPYEYEIR